MAKTLLLVHSTGNWHMYNITLNCHNWYSDARLKLNRFKTSVINSKQFLLSYLIIFINNVENNSFTYNIVERWNETCVFPLT